MYEFLRGEIIDKQATHAVLDVSGVGYYLFISLNTYDKLPSKGTVTLLTHFVVREDGQFLYGFADEEERNLFRHFISINGIGPSIARQMLSSFQPKDIVQAIISGDLSLLKAIRGIGAKSAQRIIVELQETLQKDSGLTSEGVASLKPNKEISEAIQALVSLGYNKSQAEKGVLEAVKNSGGIGVTPSVEQLIKQALKQLL